MESGVWAQGGSTCRVQVRPSASLLACPTSTVSALSHCPASASLEGLAQACPSAPMIPACPCWSTDRADAYPVPCDLVSAFHLLPVAPASWLCLPPAFIPTVPSSTIYLTSPHLNYQGHQKQRNQKCLRNLQPKRAEGDMIIKYNVVS